MTSQGQCGPWLGVCLPWGERKEPRQARSWAASQSSFVMGVLHPAGCLLPLGFHPTKTSNVSKAAEEAGGWGGRAATVPSSPSPRGAADGSSRHPDRALGFPAGHQRGIPGELRALQWNARRQRCLDWRPWAVLCALGDSGHPHSRAEAHGQHRKVGLPDCILQEHGLRKFSVSEEPQGRGGGEERGGGRGRGGAWMFSSSQVALWPTAGSILHLSVCLWASASAQQLPGGEGSPP